ncbi:MAG: hypothetical protein ACK514_17505 [Bacteroidota bacterium]|jgi:hypothetical protein|nr:hypothetical protein [Cytophagales bacterium]MCE2958026.1 hypothetical protein [Flammeovirgaceae bacterium]MCZ8069256.1 hypothetical protein [Cytophagales bacterium]
MKKQLTYLAIATVVIAASLSFTFTKQGKGNSDVAKTNEAPIGGNAVVE